MEARVEARDLRHTGKPLEHRVYRRQVVRLMERRQRDQLLQILQNRRRDNGWTGVRRAAMHDAVTDTKNAPAAVMGSEPRAEGTERAAPVGDAAVQRVIGENSIVSVLGREPRRGTDALDLAPRLQAPHVDRRPPIDAELDARGSGGEHECVVVHTQ